MSITITVDLPEVIHNQTAERLEVLGSNMVHYFGMSNEWSAEEHRKEGLARLSFAEYLDGLKPKLPTEPGSVIKASKVQGWIVNPRGDYLSLSVTGVWNSLDSNLRGIRAELIEEWVSVSLVPNEEATA